MSKSQNICIEYCALVEVTSQSVGAAEGVLIDNGIHPDEAATVLQAIGYTLLDFELYPREN